MTQTRKRLPQVGVRPAVVEDLEYILKIERETFSSDNRWSEREFREAVANSLGSVTRGKDCQLLTFVVEDKENCFDVDVIGYMAFHMSKPCKKCGTQIIRLTNFAVREDFRRCGVASGVLKNIKLMIKHSPNYRNVCKVVDLVDVRNLPMQLTLSHSGFIGMDETDGYMEFVWRREWD